MTITQSLILVLLIALWSTGNGVNLANNTTILITILIALIALSYSTTRRGQCQNTLFNAQNGIFGNNSQLFA